MIRGPFTNPFTDKLLPIVEKYASGGAIYGFTRTSGSDFRS